MFCFFNLKCFYWFWIDKVWFGVCGGLVECFGWELSLVRILFVIVFFLILGLVVLIVYVVGVMIILKELIGCLNLVLEEE